MDIGTRLRELRHAKGFSQGDIEQRTGLFSSYLSRVENGHTIPKLGTLEKWAKALDLELYQLFFIGEAKPKALRVAETAPGPPLSPEDLALLKVFNRMTTRDRRMLLDVARRMAATAKRKQLTKASE